MSDGQTVGISEVKYVELSILISIDFCQGPGENSRIRREKSQVQYSTETDRTSRY